MYERAADLIQAPEVDAVSVATPPSSHLEFGLMVAAAGKPCLMEKPMAMNYAECVRMNDAFRSPACAAFRRILPAGIGTLSEGAAAIKGRSDWDFDSGASHGQRSTCCGVHCREANEQSDGAPIRRLLVRRCSSPWDRTA